MRARVPVIRTMATADRTSDSRETHNITSCAGRGGVRRFPGVTANNRRRTVPSYETHGPPAKPTTVHRVSLSNAHIIIFGIRSPRCAQKCISCCSFARVLYVYTAGKNLLHACVRATTTINTNSYRCTHYRCDRRVRAYCKKNGLQGDGAHSSSHPENQQDARGRMSADGHAEARSLLVKKSPYILYPCIGTHV